MYLMYNNSRWSVGKSTAFTENIQQWVSKQWNDYEMLRVAISISVNILDCTD